MEQQWMNEVTIPTISANMRPTIQVNLITEQRKYLEGYLEILGPVIESMKHAVEKSKTWIEDKNDNPSFTYIELCQELESATTAMLDVASHIISRNKNNSCDGEATLSPTAPQATATENSDRNELTHQVTTQQTAEILTRLELLEKALFSLQDTKQKAEDDISEIKQWRDNFLSEQNDTALKTEKFCRQEKENIESLRQQISEQDNKVKELNKEIESLKEKETKSNKTLEKLSLDMKEYENNLHKINKEMQVYIDKTDIITKEIRIHCAFISDLQDKVHQNMVNTNGTFNNITTKLEKQVHGILKLERKVNDVLNFSTAFQKIAESRDGKRYACFARISRNPPVSLGSTISRFDDVREYNGQHINPKTGKFVSPHDGFYMVCVTLHEWSGKMIRVGVFVGDKWRQSVKVGWASTRASGSVVVDMKKGEELYFQVTHKEQNAWFSLNSSFSIVSL